MVYERFWLLRRSRSFCFGGTGYLSDLSNFEVVTLLGNFVAVKLQELVQVGGGEFWLEVLANPFSGVENRINELSKCGLAVQ
jgi:hypothetical protein